MDDLNDKIEELEEQIRRLQLTEKQLRSTLIKTETNESQLTVQLDNAKGDVEVRSLLFGISYKMGRHYLCQSYITLNTCCISKVMGQL